MVVPFCFCHKGAPFKSPVSSSLLLSLARLVFSAIEFWSKLKLQPGFCCWIFCLRDSRAVLHKLPTSRSRSPGKVKKKKKKGIKHVNIRKSLTDTNTLFYSKVNRLHALDAVKAVYLKKSFITKPKICMLHIFKNKEREYENFRDISDSHIEWHAFSPINQVTCNPPYQQHEASSYSLPLCLNQ